MYNPTSVKDYFPRASRDDGYQGSWVSFPTSYYCVWFEMDGKKYAINGKASIRELAVLIRDNKEFQKKHGDNVLTLGWQKIWTTERELLCPWCGVRPDRWEWDCDGQFPMSSCGSEQCNKLNRCHGCGKDDSAHINNLCDSCYEREYNRPLPVRIF